MHISSQTLIYEVTVSVSSSRSDDLSMTISASLLQSSVSHDPSEIILICWFAAQETFLIISWFLENVIFLQDSLMNSKLKRTAFIWNRYILYTNAFCFNFDQFNASLLNNSIHSNNIYLFFYKKKIVMNLNLGSLRNLEKKMHSAEDVMFVVRLQFEVHLKASFLLFLCVITSGYSTANSQLLRWYEISLFTLQNSPTCQGPWLIARKHVFPFLLLLITLN